TGLPRGRLRIRQHLLRSGRADNDSAHAGLRGEATDRDVKHADTARVGKLLERLDDVPIGVLEEFGVASETGVIGGGVTARVLASEQATCQRIERNEADAGVLCGRQQFVLGTTFQQAVLVLRADETGAAV